MMAFKNWYIVNCVLCALGMFCLFGALMYFVLALTQQQPLWKQAALGAAVGLGVFGGLCPSLNVLQQVYELRKEVDRLKSQQSSDKVA